MSLAGSCRRLLHLSRSPIARSAAPLRPYTPRRPLTMRSTRPGTSNADTAVYVASTVIAVVGVSYAAVPLYRAFCQVRHGGWTSAHAEAGREMGGKREAGGRK